MSRKKYKFKRQRHPTNKIPLICDEIVKFSMIKSELVPVI